MTMLNTAVAVIYVLVTLLGVLALYAVWQLTSYRTGFILLSVENLLLWMLFWHRAIQKARKEHIEYV